jgi:hypothetical protein
VTEGSFVVRGRVEDLGDGGHTFLEGIRAGRFDLDVRVRRGSADEDTAVCSFFEVLLESAFWA